MPGHFHLGTSIILTLYISTKSYFMLTGRKVEFVGADIGVVAVYKSPFLIIEPFSLSSSDPTQY